MKMRTQHTLEMQTDPNTDRRQWVVSTRIKANLLNQGAVTQLEVSLPKGGTCTSSEALPPQIMEMNQEPGKVIFKLTGEPWKSLEIAFEVHYPFPVRDKDEVARGEALFELPRAHEPASGSQTDVLIQAPTDVELLAPGRAGAAALKIITPHEMKWEPEKGSLDADRPPAPLVVGWQPYRPAVHAYADVTLTTPEGQAQVHHELRYQFPPSAKGTQPPPVTVRCATAFRMRRLFREVSSFPKLDRCCACN